MKNRAGYYQTHLSGDASYKSYVPNPLPPEPYIDFDMDLINWMIKANNELAILNTNTKRILDTSLFISMYVRKEALLSSRIEGTQATLEDICNPNIESNINLDVKEVINYIKALEYGINRLNDLPISSRLIKECHQILMENSRGDDKTPGEFRKTQNWIGPSSSTLKNASYIPPYPKEMLEALSDLDKYMNGEHSLDLLTQIALIHYQFETIHPFLDGNGRVGRLLIILFLMDREVLSSPALYLSYTLKKNKLEYYDRMTDVREKGHFEEWIRFFLKSVYESAYDANDTIEKLNILYQTNINLINKMGRSKDNILILFRYCHSNPIIDIGKTAQALNMAFNTVNQMVQKLVDVNILVMIKKQNRNRHFIYQAYIDLFNEGI